MTLKFKTVGRFLFLVSAVGALFTLLLVLISLWFYDRALVMEPNRFILAFESVLIGFASAWSILELTVLWKGE